MWRCKRKVAHRAGRGVSTTNLIYHIKDIGKDESMHAAAAEKLKESSANFVVVEGELVQKYTFTEAFPHHVDMLWLRGAGLSKNMILNGLRWRGRR